MRYSACGADGGPAGLGAESGGAFVKMTGREALLRTV